MTVSASTEHIDIVEGGAGPKAVIHGSRIRVMDIAIWHEKMGLSADEIVEQYPTISRADVHAALAYYWDHREDIEQRIQDERDYLAGLQADYVDPVIRKLTRMRVG